MTFILLLFGSALFLSTVAAFYSIVGLVSIFPAAEIPIIIMGVSLEICKLVAASWLYRNWTTSPVALKYYFTLAVLILTFITSMGIFGFLSKAHIEQTTISGDNTLQIQLIDKKIQREQKRITDAELVISQLDQAVQTLMDYDRVRGPTGAIATREKQKPERKELNIIIDDAQVIVTDLQQQKFVLNKQQIAFEAEVGPIKYIADFIYGEADKKLIEKAVRGVIIIIVLVFDPLAIIMLIAANREVRLYYGVTPGTRRGRPKRTKNKKTVTINLDEYDDTKEVVDKNDISEIPKEVLDKVFKKEKKPKKEQPKKNRTRNALYFNDEEK